MRHSWYIGLAVTFLCPAACMAFMVGAENISQELAQWLTEHPVAVVAHHMSKNSKGTSTIDLLKKKNANIVAILAPEHGFNGTVPAEHTVADTQYRGIPVMSLYKEGSGKKIDPAIIHSVDGIVVDLQDIGMRHYTYTATLFSVLKSAAEHNKRCIVLDRPNPLGACAEGPIPDATMTRTSFLASVPVPLRHGLTIGELAHYLARYHVPPTLDLVVVPMNNYRYDMQCPESLVAGISPNIGSRAACYCYSFLGLLGEVRPFDVGIGTLEAFTVLCVPVRYNVGEQVWKESQKILKRYGVASERYSYMSARKKEKMDGLRLAIPDIHKVCNFCIQQELLLLFKQSGIKLGFSDYFDVAAGSAVLRHAVLGTTVDVQHMNTAIATQLQEFRRKSAALRLYV